MRDQIDIVITSYHRPEMTWRCLKALEDHTKTPHRIILIDNGSDQETLDMLWDAKELKLIDTLILLPENIGLEPAKNLALNFVTSELYVSSDNDIVVPPVRDGVDWLGSLVELIEKDDKLAAVALTPQVFVGADKAEMFKDAPEVVERAFVGGSMRLMRTDAVRAVGGWRSNPKDMTEANRGEEHYICGKLREKGYKVGYARDLECFHMFGEENWGYGEGVEHYHRAQWPIPTDSLHGSYEEWQNRKDLGV